MDKVREKWVSVVDGSTGDALMHYAVPADRYLDFLSAFDAAAEAVGAERMEEVFLDSSNQTVSQQNATVIDRTKSPYSNPKVALSKADRDILEYLWFRDGEAVYKRVIAEATGYPMTKVENTLRKKLKKYGLVAISRNVDECRANSASSYYVNKGPAIAKLSHVGKGLYLDLSGYDPTSFEDVSKMFAHLEDYYVSRHELASGKMSLREFVASDNPLCRQISVVEAVCSVPGAAQAKAASAAAAAGIEEGARLRDLTKPQAEVIFEVVGI